MCQVCQLEGKDWRFRNGGKDKLYSSKLYRVYEGRTATLSLCYLHSIELFILGEKRFLMDHVRLLWQLDRKRKSFSPSNSDGLFF